MPRRPASRIAPRAARPVRAAMRRPRARHTAVARLAGLAAALAVGLGAAPVTAAAQQQPLDTTYARLVREYTTDPSFLPATLTSLPQSATVPSPRDHFGTIAGAPGVMHHAAEVYGYFQALAAASPRVRVDTIGRTEEGRPIMLAVVADEATMRDLDRYKRYLAQLADPRTLSADSAAALARIAKPVYYFNAGLHSPEMGSPEMVMELAYRLATSDDPSIRRIRDGVITLINPVAEPDGRDRQVDWYLNYTKGRPEYDDGFPRSAPYWGKYVVHDNNRDGIQISQALTHAIYDTYYAWHPTVMHDLHESVPLLYISTGTGPYNTTNDPIVVGEWQLMANADMTALAALGMPGVWTWGFFDGWWPGYAVWVANNHNSIGRFYETFGNAGADTYVRDLTDERYAGAAVTTQQWYRHWPPTAKVRWSSRDNVNYQEAGVLASLGFAADNSVQLLQNFYTKGANSLRRGREQAPHAYRIAGFDRQADPSRAAYLVNQLQRHGLEVRRQTQGDSTGDFWVLLDQPYRDLAVNLLGEQHFPADAQYPPYDDIAWTLGNLYGVTVQAVDDSSVLRRPGLALLTDSVAPSGAVRGRGSVYLIANRAQNELLPALYALRDRDPNARAAAIERAVTIGRDSFPAGSLVLEGANADALKAIAERFALPVVATGSAPDAPRHALDLPRVAIYHTWFSTQDEGWSRYTFDQLGIPYTSIDKDDLRAGNLRSRFDVILVPRVGGNLERLLHGVDEKWGPMPFRRTAQTPSFGTPDSTADMTGGPGFEGLAALERFARDGGTIVTLSDATRLVAESGIARELSPHTTRTLFHPGSVVRARARNARSPILYGYPDRFTIFRGNGTLWEVPDQDSAMVVLQYGTKLPEHHEPTGPMLGMPETRTAKPDSARRSSGAAAARAAGGAAGGAAGESNYVVSGLVRGESEIIGQGAIFDVPVGQGRVVAFTFDPLHRYLNQSDFPLVFNALMNWNDLP